MEIKKRQNGKIKKYGIGGMVAAGAQAALGIGQTIYGISSLRAARKEMKSLLANAPQMTLPSAYKQYADRAMDETMLRHQTETINKNLATNVAALSKAGGRALGMGLQASTTVAQEGLLQARYAQNLQAMKGLEVLGGAELDLQKRREGRFQMQYGAVSGAQDAAIANIGMGLKAAGTGMAYGADAYQDWRQGRGNSGSGAKTDTSSASGGGLPAWYTPKYAIKEQGGKTSGKFSHETNPIHMIDKNGVKVGEATGGEYILNPSQAKAISKESAYFRNLLKKKQFKG